MNGQGTAGGPSIPVGPGTPGGPETASGPSTPAKSAGQPNWLKRGLHSISTSNRLNEQFETFFAW